MGFGFYNHQSDNGSDAIGYEISRVCSPMTENVALVEFDQSPIHTTDPKSMKQRTFADSGRWTHLHKSNDE